MKTLASLLFVCVITNISIAQLSLPYSNYFDQPGDTAGWIHYALQGTDDWERGIPNGQTLNESASSYNVWATNLDGPFTQNSVMCLQSPSFDFSGSTNYLLTFMHEFDTYSYHGANIEYSIDGGNSWILLDGVSSDKVNWYTSVSIPIPILGQPGWFGSQYSFFMYSAHRLSFLNGNPDVKFRFKFGGTGNPIDGWVIDNFAIIQDGQNIIATQGPTITTSRFRPTIDVSSTIIYSSLLPTPFSNLTNYYFSYDAVYDTSDIYMGNKSGTVSGTTVNWSQTLNMIPNLSAGQYYILYQHDVNDNLPGEISDIDNWNYTILQIDSTYNLPVEYDFENGVAGWKTGGNPLWQFNPGYTHHMEGTHTGTHAWNVYNGSTTSYIESPYFDFTSLDSLHFSSWLINLGSANHILKYSVDDGATWQNIVNMPYAVNDDWFTFDSSLAAIPIMQYVKLRVYSQNMVIDDIYIGKPRADLSIEGDKLNRFTPALPSIDSVIYQFVNSGVQNAGATSTDFYWSSDSVLTGADIYLGNKTEPAMNTETSIWTSFTFTKPVSTPGKFYLFYVLDATSSVSESREANNTGYFELYQYPAQTLPYYNDFETQVDGWRHNRTLGNDNWEWAVPAGPFFTQAFSGTQAWITSAVGDLSSMSRMHLYSPIFDFSSVTTPVLEFDMGLHGITNVFAYQVQSNVTYSIDGGVTWTLLDIDTASQSYDRWYYSRNYYRPSGVDTYTGGYTTQLLFAPVEKMFAPFSTYNSRDADRNTRHIVSMSSLAGQPKVQFRFNLATDQNNGNPLAQVDGALIDNFTVREAFIDLNVHYKKALMKSSITDTINFFISIKNQGNYISVPGIVKFYLSADTLLDGSDYYMGQENVPAIRPDLYFYLSCDTYIAPANLSAYQYLLYELDASHTNNESDEANNISYWPLALDSIKTYPYLMTFDDTVVNGWHSYLKHRNGSLKPNQWRFRNIVAPAEPRYATGIVSGQMFTDQIDAPFSANQIPVWYLETPSFDFSAVDSAFLSFNLQCSGINSGNNKDGGNIDYSWDGGRSWVPLIAAFASGQAYHWFNQNVLNGLFTEPGWAFVPSPPQLDSTSISLSFLRGEKNIVFRFKYSSAHEYFGGGTRQGMRIDNFRIDGFTVDYVANDSMVTLIENIGQPNFNLNYSITNAGQTNGRNTRTRFYWSTDPVLDSGDLLLSIVDENPIAALATYNSSTLITYPVPVTQAVDYYIFYFTDSDSNLVETNEHNNLGSYKIQFLVSVDQLEINSLKMYVTDNHVVFESPYEINNNPYYLQVINSLGQIAFARTINLRKGTNNFDLPANINSEIYLISLINREGVLVRKALIQNNR